MKKIIIFAIASIMFTSLEAITGKFLISYPQGENQYSQATVVVKDAQGNVVKNKLKSGEWTSLEIGGKKSRFGKPHFVESIEIDKGNWMPLQERNDFTKVSPDTITELNKLIKNSLHAKKRTGLPAIIISSNANSVKALEKYIPKQAQSS